MEIKTLFTVKINPDLGKITLFSAGAFVIFIFLLSANQTAQAALYKCTDAKGLVEYRELRRNDAECVDINAPGKPPENPEEAMQKLRDKVDALNKAKAEQEAALEKEDQRASYCKVARGNLEVLQSEGEVVSTSSDGEKNKLNEEQRAAALKQTLKDIEYFCD